MDGSQNLQSPSLLSGASVRQRNTCGSEMNTPSDDEKTAQTRAMWEGLGPETKWDTVCELRGHLSRVTTEREMWRRKFHRLTAEYERMRSAFE